MINRFKKASSFTQTALLFIISDLMASIAWQISKNFKFDICLTTIAVFIPLLACIIQISKKETKEAELRNKTYVILLFIYLTIIMAYIISAIIVSDNPKQATLFINIVCGAIEVINTIVLIAMSYVERVLITIDLHNYKAKKNLGLLILSPTSYLHSVLPTIKNERPNKI